MKCPDCRCELGVGDRFCRACGTEVTPKMVESFADADQTTRVAPRRRVEKRTGSSGLRWGLLFLACHALSMAAVVVLALRPSTPQPPQTPAPSPVAAAPEQPPTAGAAETPNARNEQSVTRAELAEFKQELLAEFKQEVAAGVRRVEARVRQEGEQRGGAGELAGVSQQEPPRRRGSKAGRGAEPPAPRRQDRAQSGRFRQGGGGAVANNAPPRRGFRQGAGMR